MTFEMTMREPIIYFVPGWTEEYAAMIFLDDQEEAYYLLLSDIGQMDLWLFGGPKELTISS